MNESKHEQLKDWIYLVTIHFDARVRAFINRILRGKGKGARGKRPAPGDPQRARGRRRGGHGRGAEARGTGPARVRAAGAEADAHWETVPDVESLVELLHCAAGTGATAAVFCLLEYLTVDSRVQPYRVYSVCVPRVAVQPPAPGLGVCPRSAARLR